MAMNLHADETDGQRWLETTYKSQKVVLHSLLVPKLIAY